MENEEGIPKKTYLISRISKIFNGVLKNPDSTFSEFSKALKSTFSGSEQESLPTKIVKSETYWTIVGKEILTVLNEPNSLMFKLGNVHKNKIALARKSLNNCLLGEDFNKDSLVSSIVLNLLNDLNEMKESTKIQQADRVQIIQFQDKLEACMQNAQTQKNSFSSKKK